MVKWAVGGMLVVNLQVIVWCYAAAIGAVMAVNGALMLFSPRAWRRLPPWIRAGGLPTDEKYAAGWGAIHLRTVGALILALLGWVLYSYLTSR